MTVSRTERQPDGGGTSTGTGTGGEGVVGGTKFWTSVGWVVAWISLGSIMILFNKAMLTIWGFPYPVALTLYHCLFATLVTQVLMHWPQLIPLPTEWGLLQVAREGKVSRHLYLTRLVPLAFFFAACLTLGNSAYKYLSVAFIQMLKSLTPVCILLVAILIGKEKPSVIQLVLVTVICVGVGLASTGELQFSALGFALQLSAILCDVCRMTIIDVLMVDVKLDSLSMLYYLAPTSSVLIFFVFLLFEYDAATFPWSRVFFDPSFGSAVLLNGIFAILLNLTVFIAVANTSSVIIGVSGLVKDMLLVVSSVIFLGSPISTQQIIGYAISLSGLNAYREFRSDPPRFTARAFEALGRVRQFLLFATACCLGRGRGTNSWKPLGGLDDDEADDDVELLAPPTTSSSGDDKT